MLASFARPLPEDISALAKMPAIKYGLSFAMQVLLQSPNEKGYRISVADMLSFGSFAPPIDTERFTVESSSGN